MLYRVKSVIVYTIGASTNLLVWIHRSESALVARLPTLASDILNLFVRSVGEITRVGVVGHSEDMSR